MRALFFSFFAFLSVQGIVVSVSDSVSMRLSKFALSKYVPIIGGYLSDGFNYLIAGSIVIKNAIGITAIYLLFLEFLPIYLSRFLINAGYDSLYTKISLEDSRHQLFSKLKMIFTPTVGSLSNFQFNLGFNFYYQIEEDKFSFSLGGILDL
jgi:hypothetical protein